MRIDVVAQIRDLIAQGTSDAAHERVARERTLVDRLLSRSAQPIYGFTTLLGDLDDRSAREGDQSRLLESHLVGPIHDLPAEWGQLLITVKLAQLAHGGSGIHPHTHALLMTAADGGSNLPRRWLGNWLTSYGSGDVVPGAWFVENLQRSGTLEIRHAGDLIALINGSFVSTSAGLIVADRFSALAGEALDVIDAASASGRLRTQQQQPVTLRDVDPIRHMAKISQTALLAALHRRLAKPSCNPRFLILDESAKVLSQSSFLDFSLTGALSQAAQTCAQLAAYLKACIRQQTAQDVPNSTARLQPLKIAEALLREIGAIALPTNFAISESAGIEDVCDQSLLTARTLATALERLDQLIDLHFTVHELDRERRPGVLNGIIPGGGLGSALVL